MDNSVDHLQRVREAWDSYNDAQRLTFQNRNVLRKEVENALSAGVGQAEIARGLSTPRQQVNRLMAVDRLGVFAIEAVMTVSPRRAVSREQRLWFERSLGLLASRGLVRPESRWEDSGRVFVRLGAVAEDKGTARDVAGHIIRRRAQYDAELGVPDDLELEFVSVTRIRDYVG